MGGTVGFLLILFVLVVTGGGRRVIGHVLHGKDAPKTDWYKD